MNVSFDEEPQYTRQTYASAPKSFLVRLMYTLGLAKTDVEAQRALLVIVVLCIVGAIAFWVFSPSSNPKPPPVPGIGGVVPIRP